MDSGVIVKEFRNRFGAIIANGQGSMKGQIFRIAHLGYFDFADLFAVIAGLEIILNANGHPVKFGTGVAAVQTCTRKRVAEGSISRLTKLFCAAWTGHAMRARESIRRKPDPNEGTCMNILIAEPLAPAGIELLQAQAGWNVIVSNPKEYDAASGRADALLVRSAVQVTKDVLAKAPKLRVIGRAGVGVDNVDLDAATAAGVLVMNTPGGNAISVAEHTLALMLSMARPHSAGQRLDHAPASGKRRSSGQRAARQDARHRRPRQHRPRSGEARRAFEMRIVAHDPYVSPQIAVALEVPLLSARRLCTAERLHHAARRR